MANQKTRIVTDTTAVLPEEYVRAHQIEVVPQIVGFGNETFFENKTIRYDDFLRRLKSAKQLPKTAAPQPGDLIDAYRRQLVGADTVLSIHPSAQVSGTIRSAETARATEFANADIRILDSQTVCGNLGSMVIAATEMIERGMEADEIVTRIQTMIPRGRTYFLVATLEYLQKGGRIGGASALFGTALQIKPILEIRAGRVEAFEKIRTHSRALERLKELVTTQCPHSSEARLCVMHSDTPELAQQLAQEFQTKLGIAPIPIYLTSASITTHSGPGTVGVGFFTA